MTFASSSSFLYLMLQYLVRLHTYDCKVSSYYNPEKKKKKTSHAQLLSVKQNYDRLG